MPGFKTDRSSLSKYEYMRLFDCQYVELVRMFDCLKTGAMVVMIDHILR